MPDMLTAPEPAVGVELASKAARILDQANVPNILWGWIALGLCGARTGHGDIDFVIPDDSIEQATLALERSGYQMCTSEECNELKNDRCWELAHEDNPTWETIIADDTLDGASNRYHPVPLVHFHVYEGRRPSVISLQCKSEIFPWLPEYGAGPPEPDSLFSIRANDLLKEILREDVFTESVLWYVVSNLNFPTDPQMDWWGEMLDALSDEMYEPGFRRRLHPRFRLIWEYLMDRKPKNHDRMVPLATLRERMIETKEIQGPSLKGLFAKLDGWDEVVCNEYGHPVFKDCSYLDDWIEVVTDQYNVPVYRDLKS
ncbi:hypothetical protein BJX99DRAFT_265046 [Aspergillus californicus]